MLIFKLLFFLLILRFRPLLSECENACSGHGRCTMYDMCICNRNWEGNDCRNRICQFGPSFVDAPKGDLDGSDSIDNTVVAVNNFIYPYGTTEQFPEMLDSDLQIVSQSAHYYSECSGAGLCNRLTGECECFEGFEGSSCQRMKCPGEPVCNGRGLCQTLKQIARYTDYGSYQLWDKNIIRGCVCDKQFYGSDCLFRKCKMGIDPLYLDDLATLQYPYFFFAIMTTSPTYDVTNGQNGPGYFNIKFYDIYEQYYYTKPIQAPASCSDIVSALEHLPNSVVPKDSLECQHKYIHQQDPLNSNNFNFSYNSLYKNYLSGVRTYTVLSNPLSIEAGYVSSYSSVNISDPDLSGDLYFIKFLGNPGNIRQPHINVYLDGKSPSITSPGGVLVTKSWTNGQQGITVDYFSRHCHSVRIQLKTVNGETFLYSPLLSDEYLRKCLYGNGKDEIVSAVEEGEFPDGSIYHPFVARLVKTQTGVLDGGFYIVFFWDPHPQNGIITFGWRVLHPIHPLENITGVLYDMYVSDGFVQLVGNNTQAEFDFGSNHIYLSNISYNSHEPNYFGDISCERFGPLLLETNTSNMDCLDSGDLFFLIDPYHTENNPSYLNLYTANSIRNVNPWDSVELGDIVLNIPNHARLNTRKHMIITDLNTNWAQRAEAGGTFHIYKFVPNKVTNYELTTECSNRGVCNPFEGICECFHGFTGDACQTQNALAI